MADNPEKRIVVVIGDSIAVGTYGDSAKRTFTHRLENMSHGDWFFLNASRGGATLAPGGPLPPVDPLLLGLKGVMGDDVLVMLGINDYQVGLPLADVADSLNQLLDNAVLWDIAITCVTPLWFVGEETITNKLGLTVEDYRAVIRQTCMSRGGHVIEGLNLVPHDTRLFANGRVHPNDRGNGYLAKRLHEQLRNLGW